MKRGNSLIVSVSLVLVVSMLILSKFFLLTDAASYPISSGCTNLIDKCEYDEITIFDVNTWVLDLDTLQTSNYQTLKVSCDTGSTPAYHGTYVDGSTTIDIDLYRDVNMPKCFLGTGYCGDDTTGNVDIECSSYTNPPGGSGGYNSICKKVTVNSEIINDNCMDYSDIFCATIESVVDNKLQKEAKLFYIYGGHHIELDKAKL